LIIVDVVDRGSIHDVKVCAECYMRVKLEKSIVAKTSAEKAKSEKWS